MQTATCPICYGSKTPTEYSQNTCTGCSTHRAECEKTFSSAHPDATESEILYAGRMALEQRRASAQQKFVNPFNFNRSMAFVKTSEGSSGNAR